MYNIQPSRRRLLRPQPRDEYCSNRRDENVYQQTLSAPPVYPTHTGQFYFCAVCLSIFEDVPRFVWPGNLREDSDPLHIANLIETGGSHGLLESCL